MAAVPGTLYIVATPIGNLEDMSARARRVLGEVDLIAAEDTRHSGKLLQHFGITTPLLSLHEHNETQRVQRLLEELRSGRSVALISDAGTPLISDPGYELVRAAHAAGITVSPVPGPSALTAALSAAGLPTDRFVFEGFLPARGAARRARLEALAGEPRTLVFYESVHRLADSLDDMRSVLGAARHAVLAREISKLHEAFHAGTLQDLAGWARTKAFPGRGEFVLLVAGAEASRRDESEILRVLDILLAELPVRQAAALAAKLTGEKKNRLYQLALEKRKEED